MLKQVLNFRFDYACLSGDNRFVFFRDERVDLALFVSHASHFVQYSLRACHVSIFAPQQLLRRPNLTKILLYIWFLI